MTINLPRFAVAALSAAFLTTAVTTAASACDRPGYAYGSYAPSYGDSYRSAPVRTYGYPSGEKVRSYGFGPYGSYSCGSSYAGVPQPPKFDAGTRVTPATPATPAAASVGTPTATPAAATPAAAPAGTPTAAQREAPLASPAETNELPASLPAEAQSAPVPGLPADATAAAAPGAELKN
ncbi:MAG: hypothetical protein ACF8TS_04765 [Maioricimonas sp. JB049]